MFTVFPKHPLPIIFLVFKLNSSCLFFRIFSKIFIQFDDQKAIAENYEFKGDMYRKRFEGKELTKSNWKNSWEEPSPSVMVVSMAHSFPLQL